MIVSAEYQRGAGLGNKLFPWARAFMFARRHGCPMLRMRWFSPHGGAITRGGIDYAKAARKILLIGNFRTMPDELSLFAYLWRYRRYEIRRCKNIEEAEHEARDSVHIRFTWCDNHEFMDLKGCQADLKKRLQDMTSRSQLRFVKSILNDFKQGYIGVNIRCGKDFIAAESGARGYVQTKIDWFSSALAEIRKNYGNLPALVVSDGGRRQLSSLLEDSETYLLESPSAIADLLTLTNARVLLGSGNSTFSAWASFLGEMDTFSSGETPFLHNGLADGRLGQKIVGVI